MMFQGTQFDHDGLKRNFEKGIRWVLNLIGAIFGFGDDIIAVAASAVRMKTMRWLWPGRVPLGKLTLFVGDPDKGKSLAAIYVAAATSTGENWYGAAGAVENPNPEGGDVLIFADEDDAADTIVPRLAAAGAYTDRVFLCSMQHQCTNEAPEQRQMNLSRDILSIKTYLSQHPSIRLVVLDPVSNYMGSNDMNKEQEVRNVLTPLVKLAEEKSVAILGVMHMNKGEEKRAINRVSGAKAYVGVARSVWLFESDPDEPEVSQMLLVKQNIAEGKGGLKFRISVKDVEIEGEKQRQPFVEWTGETTLSADEVLAKRNPRRGRPNVQLELAKQILPQWLSSGPRPAAEIEAAGHQLGLSDSTMDRAKRDLGIKSAKSEDGWNWQPPQRK